MEPAKWTEIVEAISAAGSFLVTIVGFIFVLRQLRQVDQSIRGDTNASLCQQSLEILNAMMSRKGCYKFFYDGISLANDDPDREEILLLTEMIVNYLDLVALQKDNMPSNVWPRWKNFISDTIESSPVVTEHLTKFAFWYSEELNLILKQISKNERRDKK